MEEHFNDRFKEGTVRLSRWSILRTTVPAAIIVYGDGNADDFTRILLNTNILKTFE